LEKEKKEKRLKNDFKQSFGKDRNLNKFKQSLEKEKKEKRSKNEFKKKEAKFDKR